jgi:hypothetical protein
VVEQNNAHYFVPPQQYSYSGGTNGETKTQEVRRMFQEQATYDAQRRQLMDAMRTLRDMPARLVDVLREIASDFDTLYRQRAELRDESWQKRLTSLIQRGEQRIDQLRQQAETAYATAERVANVLANVYPLPQDPSERTAFLAQYSVACNRLTALVGFGTDSDTADAVNRLLVSGALELDAVLALACWLHAGEIADARQWSLTQAVLQDVARVLPEPLRGVVQLGSELGSGYARLQAGFAQAYKFVRLTARERVVIPAWNPNDGVTWIDSVSTQRTNAVSAVV